MTKSLPRLNSNAWNNATKHSWVSSPHQSTMTQREQDALGKSLLLSYHIYKHICYTNQFNWILKSPAAEKYINDYTTVTSFVEVIAEGAIIDLWPSHVGIQLTFKLIPYYYEKINLEPTGEWLFNKTYKNENLFSTITYIKNLKYFVKINSYKTRKLHSTHFI